ncbi:MAG: hypothetical protein Q9186_000639 [Xanthomendoza sp. 1 TL-2023]
MAVAKGNGSTNEHARKSGQEIAEASRTPSGAFPTTNDQTSPQSERPSSDGGNPFYQDAGADEESVVTTVKETPRTLGGRLRRIVQRQRKASSSESEFTGDAERDQLINSLDHYTVGYPKVAAFENADPSFLIYRKFGWLHNRLLLYLQDELAELEYKLDKLDKETFSDDEDIKLCSRRDDWTGRSLRRDLIKQIAQKLEEYGKLGLLSLSFNELLHGARAYLGLSRPTPPALSEGPSDEKTDNPQPGILIPLPVARDQEHGWFNGFLADNVFNFNRFSRTVTQYVFRTKEQKIVSGQEDITLFDPHRLDIFLRSILTILAAALLLAPVLILFKLQPSKTDDDVPRSSKFQILTIFLFTLLFSASCSVFTKARRQEVFTATAAYCAVLVVFLGNTLNASSRGAH